MTTTLAASATTVRASATPTSRINPDTRLVLAGLLLVLVAVAAASFTLSFTGVSAAAPWAAIPAELAWLVPVALEVAMLAYVVTAAVRTHRGQHARLAWTLVWALTTVSSAINALHAWDAGPQGWQGLVGAGLAAMFPFMTLAAAHVVVGVAFAPRPDAVPVTATETDTAPAPAPASAEPVMEAAGIVTSEGRGSGASATGTARTARTDGHRPARRTPGRIAEHRDEIVRLARTTSRSGRDIAASLGLDKTPVCAIVREERVRTDRVNVLDAPLPGTAEVVGSRA